MVVMGNCGGSLTGHICAVYTCIRRQCGYVFVHMYTHRGVCI